MRLAHVSLPCADVARALAFYRGLGLAPLVVENGDDGAPRYARLAFPDGDGTLSLERAAVSPAGGGGAVVYFECADLEARAAALGRAGYTFASPVETKPWLWREALLLDPDGHRICLFRAGSYRLDPPWRVAAATAETPAPPAARRRDDERDEPDELAPFAGARNRGYAEAPIPSGRDEQIAAYLDRLAADVPAARERAASALGPAYTSTFLAFAERMASLAVRRLDGGPLGHGLLAVGLVWRAAADVRPAIPVLGVLHDASARVKADAVRLFAGASALVPADVAPLYADFLRRPDLAEIAEEMGYAPGQDRDGFRYRRTWGTGQVDPDPAA